MGNVQVEAFPPGPWCRWWQPARTFAVDGVDLGAGSEVRAGHKLLVAMAAVGSFSLYAVASRLGLGVIQEGLVTLAEILRGSNRVGRSVRHGLIFVEQVLEFLSGFHLENPSFLVIYL